MRRRCAAEREVFVLNHKKGCYYCERDAAFQELLFELCVEGRHVARHVVRQGIAALCGGVQHPGCGA